MKKILLLVPILTLVGCGSDPSDAEGGTPNRPAVKQLSPEAAAMKATLTQKIGAKKGD